MRSVFSAVCRFFLERVVGVLDMVRGTIYRVLLRAQHYSMLASSPSMFTADASIVTLRTSLLCRFVVSICSLMKSIDMRPLISTSVGDLLPIIHGAEGVGECS